MTKTLTFGDVLDAIHELPIEQQEDVVEVVRRRLNERARQRIIEDVREAEAEYARGECRVMSVDEIMREIES